MKIKGVIVAAGYGTRLLPATKTLPKEMLPLVDTPSIDFIIKEFIESGIKDILIITHRKKKALEDYFDRDPELEKVFIENGKIKELEKIKPYDANIVFTRQKVMNGTGNALLEAESWLSEGPFVMAYPDDIVFSEKPLALQMIEAYQKHQKSILAVMSFPGDVSRYGVIDPFKKLDEKTYQIKGIVEKPKPGEEPSRMISIGRYLFEPSIFEKLKTRLVNHEKGEFYVTEGIEELALEEKVAAYEFTGKRIDTGQAEAFFEAVLEYSLMRPDLKKVLCNFIKERNLYDC